MKHFWNVCLAACVAAALGPLTGCAPDPTYETDAYEAEHLRGSMHALTATMVHDIFSPPQAARAYAYPSIAAYEAVRHLDPSAESMAGRLNGLEQISEPDQPILAPLASLRAFLRVGQALVFSEERIASYAEARYEAFRQMGVPSELFDASIAYGDLVAEEVLTWASSDYYLETRSYPKFTVTGEPGVWQPTPPAYMDGVEPHWREIRPFVLDSAAQFSPPPPPPYSVEEGSPFMELVEEVYEVGNELTYEERAIASFWDCNPYVMHTRGHVMFATKKITPGGHWIGIAGHASRATDADFVSTARTYALTAIALSDAFISAWDEKYRSNLVRPETVINEHIDPDWIPLLQTPPFPEHTSGHSVISAAAATVLTNLYGPQFAFDDTTEVRYGLPVRSFASFEAAAEEAAVSRLYGGIHYRPAIDDGFVQGEQVGQLALQELIEPDLAASPESTVSPEFTVSQAVSE